MSALEASPASLADTEALIGARVAAFRGARDLRHPKAKLAAALLDANDPDAAERELAKFLGARSPDAGALNLMAEIAIKRGDTARAATLLSECLARAPNFALARFHYADTLHRQNRLPEALAELDLLLARDPHNFLVLDLKSVVLALMGRLGESLACRKTLVDDYPAAPELWIKYGTTLRGTGEMEACIAAFRNAIALQPSGGSAWWALADLKTYRFSETETAEMERLLARSDLSGSDRMLLQFALGKALGDRGEYANSFQHYARANALKRMTFEYDADTLTRQVEKSQALFTAGFFRAREGTGCASPDPVFIVGMQRAGSTLVEQILASHSAIEPTAELPDISLLAQHVGEEIGPKFGEDYPGVLARLDAATLAALGERYLGSTRFRRRESRPLFLDKMPYNFFHLGLIRLILPRAKIVDVRRHPLACCFSNFVLHYESGPRFAYRLNELGRAYSDYVTLMAHFDRVQRGHIHRLMYEDLVRDPEREIRRLLDYLELPFEDNCLRFHENRRAMSSVSAEQVRRPLSGEAVDRWRHYEPWLGPLKAALGTVLDS